MYEDYSGSISEMRKKLAEGGESSLGKVISNLHRQVRQLKQEKVALEAQLVKAGSFSLPFTTDSSKFTERVNCGLSEKSARVAKQTVVNELRKEKGKFGRELSDVASGIAS